MKKYKIYEVVTTSLEARSFYHDYSQYRLDSYLLREFDYSDLSYSEYKELTNGFETFQAAEEWLIKNQQEWVRYTIQVEYYKDE